MNYRRIIRVIVGIAVVGGIVAALGLAKRTDDISSGLREPSDLGELSATNDTLSMLREYADNLTTLRLKLLQLEYINRKRALDHQPALKYDLLAGRVMASHIAEQTRERTFAHKNLAGELCFHRWARTGRTDHVRENLFAVFSTGPFSRDLEEQAKRMRKGVDAFLAERPPEDGHKKTLLDPFATHVGIAFQQSPDDRSWRYGELYVNKYVELAPVPQTMHNGDTLKLDLKFDKTGYGPYCFLAYWSPPLEPTPRREQFTAKPYNETTDVMPIQCWPWDFTGYGLFDRSITVYLPIRNVKPGILYGVFYIRDKISGIPYRGGKATTDGTIPAAAIVVNIGNGQ